jgi:hypothetical protein
MHDRPPTSRRTSNRPGGMATPTRGRGQPAAPVCGQGDRAAPPLERRHARPPHPSRHASLDPAAPAQPQPASPPLAIGDGRKPATPDRQGVRACVTGRPPRDARTSDPVATRTPTRCCRQPAAPVRSQGRKAAHLPKRRRTGAPLPSRLVSHLTPLPVTAARALARERWPRLPRQQNGRRTQPTAPPRATRLFGSAATPHLTPQLVTAALALARGQWIRLPGPQ